MLSQSFAEAFASWCVTENVDADSEDFIPALRLALENFALRLSGDEVGI